MFFGLIPCKWHTCTIAIPYTFGDVTLDAVFNTLEEAQEFCGINADSVIDREVISE